MTRTQRGLAEIDAAGVAARQRWRHWRGTTYTIVGVGLFETTQDPVVMYAGADGIVWVRSLYVFLEEARPGLPRFTRVDGLAPDGRPRGGRFI